VLESADDILDIPGFGHNQLQSLWAVENSHRNPVAKRIVRKFGWTSGAYSVDLVEGYRMTEDIFVYMVLSDDSFAIPTQAPDLQESYYGAGLFPSIIRQGKKVRGNLVIYKILLKNKQWRSQPEVSPNIAFMWVLGDDSTLLYEYEMYPLCKAEIAHMLVERRRALDEDGYTRRTWRKVLRQREAEIEQQKAGAVVV
jgi:hypothetical protein